MGSLNEAFTRPSAPFRARSAGLPPSSVVHFHVWPEMDEVRAYASERGWLEKGFTQLSIGWTELRYSTDGWKTTHVLKSTDVPCPVVGGYYFLPGVPRGTDVEIAVQVGVFCRAPSDTAGYRERGSVWFNNSGRNYCQTSR
jgi:hypothetical protein